MEQQLSAYSDFSNVNFNIYNFTFLFGSYEEGKIIPMGKIKMSPETAKALSELLQTNIEAYEKTYGPINVYDDQAKANEKILSDSLKAKDQEKALTDSLEEKEEDPESPTIEGENQ